MKEIFIDSDIILDLLARREPFYHHAAKLFSYIEKGKLRAYISPVIFANIYYILSRIKNKEFARNSLRKLKLLVKILPVDEKIIDLAMASDLKDFEDAIQYYVALENDIHFILTRNKKDYKNADITALTAEEYLNTIKDSLK